MKVQFDWDRQGKRDENSSCWVRVSHPWAGKGWGAIAIPRIGQEVIVDFLEGDPDRPIITGRVYNAEAMPPYGLPGQATMSGLKSDSTKGGGGYNALRFEDKKGSEQVFLHAQKDMDAKVQEKRREWVGQSCHMTVDGEKREKVGQDKYVHVAGNTWTWVDSSMIEEVLQEYCLKAERVIISAGSEICLKVGENFVTIGREGVIIQGAMTYVNCGNTPSSSTVTADSECTTP